MKDKKRCEVYGCGKELLSIHNDRCHIHENGDGGTSDLSKTSLVNSERKLSVHEMSRRFVQNNL